MCSAQTSSPSVASACGSRSSTSVGTPRASAADASPSTTEVLPTPPLRLHTLSTITAGDATQSRPNCGQLTGRATPQGRTPATNGAWCARRCGPGGAHPPLLVPSLLLTTPRGRAPGLSGAPKGQLSPEPLRRQDREGEATPKGEGA